MNFPALLMFLACTSLQGSVTQITTRICVQFWELVTSAYTFIFKVFTCTQGHSFRILTSVQSTSIVLKRLVQTKIWTLTYNLIIAQLNNNYNILPIKCIIHNSLTEILNKARCKQYYGTWSSWLRKKMKYQGDIMRTVDAHKETL